MPYTRFQVNASGNSTKSACRPPTTDELNFGGAGLVEKFRPDRLAPTPRSTQGAQRGGVPFCVAGLGSGFGFTTGAGGSGSGCGAGCCSACCTTTGFFFGLVVSPGPLGGASSSSPTGADLVRGFVGRSGGSSPFSGGAGDCWASAKASPISTVSVRSKVGGSAGSRCCSGAASARGRCCRRGG